MIRIIAITGLVLLFVFSGSCLAIQDISKSSSTVKVQKVDKKKKQIKKESKENKVSETLVTFVELGSVKCIPCKMMQPVMKELEEEYSSKGLKIIFYDVWTKEGRPYAEKYKIMAIPTQVFLDKDGKEFFRHQGFFPKDKIVEVLKKEGIK